ncbi:MAG: GC-type dockerin domain-anchored protein [Planctomycetota bacterium]
MDQQIKRLWCAVAALVAAAVMPAGAAAQFALNDPSSAIARDTSPPAVWRTQPLTEDSTWLIAWYGNSSSVLSDPARIRSLLTAYDPSSGEAVLEIGYTASGGLIGGARDAAGSWRAMTPVGPPAGVFADTHHAAIGTFDADGGPGGTGRFTLFLLREGEPTAAAEYIIDSLGGGLAPLAQSARIYLGDPRAEPQPALYASHTDPLFTVFARRGLLTLQEIEQEWSRAEGPRLRELFGPNAFSEDDTIFIYGQTGDQSFETPGITGRVYAWFDGDPAGWLGWLDDRPAVLVGPAGLPAMTMSPVYEPGFVWSGFWQLGTPSLLLELDPVPGELPEFRGVLTGTRTGSEPLVAWGLGNSRWANTTPVPATIGSAQMLSRSHLYGLRASRPAYDGGFVILDLSADGNLSDLSLDEPNGFLAPRLENWTRFSYGGSQVSLPGNGRVSQLPAVPGTLATPLIRVTRPDVPTDSVAVLLARPNGGVVSVALAVATADEPATTVSDAPPLFDHADLIETNTARDPLGTPVLDVASDSITLPDSAVVEIGDAVVVAPLDAVSVITEVLAVEDGRIRYRLEHPWVSTRSPSIGDTAYVGPWQYVQIGFGYDTPDPAMVRRGIRFEHVSGGRVTVVGAGYRERVGNRIQFVLAGRGGLGQQQQADREFAGSLAGLSDALGVGLFFAGNATQAAGTQPALEAQLGARINDREFVGTPDVVSATNSTFFVQKFQGTNEENRNAALTYDGWAYLQTQDEFAGMFDQAMAFWRLDPAHPNGRGMRAAADAWWTAIEGAIDTVILGEPCVADVNTDGMLDSADFFAWVVAFGEGDPAADQNEDGSVDSADFFAWVSNFGLGCS